ncbi:MAG: amino acid permease [Acidobacteriaceae bacterium]|nr:amino acid permease [Acidobacteriaceae bacterium]MBV9780161.1 amino acid permease [Acidobacteriaceae bacterium]
MSAGRDSNAPARSALQDAAGVRPAELARRLSLGDSIAIVVGVMIGGGIFLIPNLVARSVPSMPAIMGVWVVAGVISLIGALACAELGAAFPETGGQYVFLREAYGRFAAFLCGWSFFTVARSAQVAWLSVVFSIYASYLAPLTPAGSKVLSLAVLALFTWANYRGVKLGAIIQNSFTLAKVAGLLIIVGAALLLGGHASRHTIPGTSAISLSSFGVALTACLLAYDGWVQLTFVAGEISNPKRNVMGALTFGTLGVAAIYLVANLAYMTVFSISEIAASEHVGADAAARVLGPAGGTLVSLVILISILGTLNGCFLTIPRVYFAQAADGLFFQKFADVHPRYGTPGFAIVAQFVWAAVLLLTGSYESLIDYSLFGIWVFYGLMIAAVMVLRRTRPEVPRPYRMWGYPATPILFLIITVWFVCNMLVTRPGPAFAGLGLIVTGVPAYLLWRRYASKPLGQQRLAEVQRPS